MTEINKVKVAHDVKNGEVVIENILGTGADVVTTKNVKIQTHKKFTAHLS